MSILVTFSKFLMQRISPNYYQNNTLNNLRLAEFSSFSTSFIPNILFESMFLSSSFASASPIKKID